jgi:metallo-beta-lactamase class B
LFAETLTAAALAAACAGKDGWNDPAPPARIWGNTFYVGTCGISAVLVTSPAGHVLVDGGTAKAAPLVSANIERLGFRLRDVRWIVGSHEHFDHAGALAPLKRMTGARFAAPAAARAVYASGKPAADDPQSGALDDFAPIRLDRGLRDGDIVRLGPLRLTAHFTPAHSPFGVSWTWRSCEGATCLDMAMADSISAISADGYRFGDHPERTAAFGRGMAVIDRLPCDILITPHPGGSNLFGRLSGRAPLADPYACRTYAATGRGNLARRLADEARAAPR